MTFIRMLFLVMLIPHLAFAADITNLEYYIDTDPGLGVANQVTITGGPTVTAQFPVNLAGLNEGTHYLYVRAQDAYGQWSIHRARPFFMTGVSTSLPIGAIEALEYYIDTDPGLGEATPVTIDSGPAVTVQVPVDLADLSEGIHYLYLRAKDVAGQWSVHRVRPFYMTAVSASLPISSITALEYFFDTDPGQGLATAVPVAPDSSLATTFAVDFSALTPGSHYLFTRVQDEAGVWGISRCRHFYIMAAEDLIVPDVVSMEYFIDDDPGYGSGIAIPVTAGTAVSGNTVVDISVLAVGSHTIEVRALDSNGIWSPIATRSFAVGIDSDGDAVPDSLDAFPEDPQESLDTDLDGIGNNDDPDDDNDSMPDTWEIANGFDPLTPYTNHDADGDGISDLDEYFGHTDPKVINYFISGRVTNSSGTALADVLVEGSSDTNWFSTASDQDGNYVLPVSFGSYRVMIWGADGYQTVFYDSAATWLAATVVDVTDSSVNGIDFTLSTGLSISGTVTNLGAGEDLQIDAWSVDTQGWTSVKVTGTGAPVSYELIGLAAADDYVITTWGENYPSGALQADASLSDQDTAQRFSAGVTDANITLASGYTLSGTISGVVAGDTIWVDVWSSALGIWSGVEVTATSDSAAYQVTNLPNATDYLVSFQHEDYLSGFYGDTDSGALVNRTLAVPLTISSGNLSGIDVTLSFGLGISGRVSGLAGGQSAWIDAWSASTKTWGATRVDGTDGSEVEYSISGLSAADDYLVSIWSDGLMGGFYNSTGIVAEDEAEQVSISSSSAESINFTLSAGHTISGTITDLAVGEPALLDVWSESTWSWGRSLVVGTGSTVTYAIKGLPPAGDFVVTFAPRNHLDQQVAAQNSGDDPTVDFTCTVGHSLTGNISSLGAYVPVTVAALPVNGNLIKSTLVRTAADGTAGYTITGLDPADNYIIRAEADDKKLFYANSTSLREAVPVAMSSGDRINIDFNFDAVLPHVLSGAIAGVAAEAAVWVDAWDESTWVWQGVNIIGNSPFSMELPEGSYKVGFLADGSADVYFLGADTTTVDISAATAVVLATDMDLGTVTLSNGYAVSGTIYLDANTDGFGQDSENLAAVAIEVSGGGIVRSVVSNRLGYYQIKGLPDGAYTLSVLGEYGSYTGEITISGNDLADQNILLGAAVEGTADLSGTIEDDSGIALSGAVVMIFSADGLFINALVTDAAGGFNYPGLSTATTYTLKIDADVNGDFEAILSDVVPGVAVTVTVP